MGKKGIIWTVIKMETLSGKRAGKPCNLRQLKGLSLPPSDGQYVLAAGPNITPQSL